VADELILLFLYVSLVNFQYQQNQWLQ